MKVNLEILDAMRIDFEMPNNLKEYQEVWLLLTNTVKDRSNEFLKLKNDYDNGAYVVIDHEEVEVKDVTGWLKRIGCSQIEESKVKTVSAYFDYELSDDDMDYEMLEIREY